MSEQWFKGEKKIEGQLRSQSREVVRVGKFKGRIRDFSRRIVAATNDVLALSSSIDHN